jgi:quercetin dioxygenase-like cupin family protein
MNRRAFVQSLSAGTVGALVPSEPASAARQQAPPRTTTAARIVTAEQGVTWDMEPSRRMTFKLLSEQTGDRVSIFEETVPSGAGTPLHIHRTSDEVIQVVSGELTIRLGTQVTTVGRGAWVFIPRGSVHGFRNRSQTAARAAYVFTPSDGAKVFEEGRRLGALPNPDPAIMAKFQALWARFGYEFVAMEWE